MNKTDLTAKIATKLTTEEKKVPKKAVSEFIDAFTETITETLAAGEDITLVGFGSFKVSEVGERKAKNLQTGEDVIVPPHKRASFRVGKALKAAVK